MAAGPSPARRCARAATAREPAACGRSAARPSASSCANTSAASAGARGGFRLSPARRARGVGDVPYARRSRWMCRRALPTTSAFAWPGRGHRRARWPAGDLYVLVGLPRTTASWRRQRPRERHRRSATAAALGTKVTVPTWTERRDRRVRPARAGTVITLRGRGSQYRRRGRGDQTDRLNVAIPRNLTARQRELLSELRNSLTEANRARSRMSRSSPRSGGRSADPARVPRRPRRPTGAGGLARARSRRSGAGRRRRIREYAIYGAPGDSPRIRGEVEVGGNQWSCGGGGGGRLAERWRQYHQPVLVGGRV